MKLVAWMMFLVLTNCSARHDSIAESSSVAAVGGADDAPSGPRDRYISCKDADDHYQTHFYIIGSQRSHDRSNVNFVEVDKIIGRDAHSSFTHMGCEKAPDNFNQPGDNRDDVATGCQNRARAADGNIYQVNIMLDSHNKEYATLDRITSRGAMKLATMTDCHRQ